MSRPLPQLVADGAQAHPERPFLVEVGAGTRSYADVHRAALRWRTALERAGVARGDHVLVLAPAGPTPVEAWLGAAWLGAVEVPVNTAFRGRMLEYVVADSAATVAVVHADLVGRLAELDTLGALRTVVVVGGAVPDDALRGVTVVPETAFLRVDPEPAATDPQPHDVASVLYTSGTTGPSKGVLVPWAQIEATTEGSIPGADVGPGDVFYSPFPLCHISGKFPLLLMATRGSHVVMRAGFDTGAFWSDVARHGCTTTLLLGAMANFLHRQPPRPDDAQTPLRNVVMVPLIDDLDAFRTRFGVRVCTVFNMTETSAPLASDGWAPADTRTCGRPRPGYECRIADEHDREVAPGVVGELLVRTDEPWRLMAGYWGKPEATAAAWRNGWLHTGDGFWRDEAGNHYFADRLKDAIRRRGENISSAEVEADVNRHPAVLESAAVAVPSEWGEDEVKVVVALKPGAGLSPQELHAYLRERMPRFMLPRYVELVAALPKTQTQKVRKHELRAAGITPATWDGAAEAVAAEAGGA